MYYIDNANRKGLIAAISDAPSPGGGAVYDWDPDSVGSIPGSEGVELFDGLTNTNAITVFSSSSAASVARDYPVMPCPATITCDEKYSLPSQAELMLLWGQYKTIPLLGFLEVEYWSSTQRDDTVAWYVEFINGIVGSSSKSFSYGVRPVRTFYY